MDMTLKHARLLICAGLVALSATAGAAVNKCVDQDGQLLLTDVPCPQGSRLIDAEVSDGPEVGIILNSGNTSGTANSGIEHVPAGIQAVTAPPRSRWADLPRPLQRRQVGLDASTLQAARMNLQMQDEIRHQRAVASR